MQKSSTWVLVALTKQRRLFVQANLSCYWTFLTTDTITKTEENRQTVYFLKHKKLRDANIPRASGPDCEARALQAS